MAVIQDGIDRGLHRGAQLYLGRQGVTVADLAVGMTTDTPMPWLSSTKPVAAVAIAQLWERQKLELDDPVMKHIPEFGNNGKEAITIRHLLTHTAGIRAIAGNWEDAPREQVIEAICRMRVEPGWVPGKKAGYHAATTWYILGELVRRLDGRPFEQYVREEVLLPAGMKDSSIDRPGAGGKGPIRDLGRFYEMLLNRGTWDRTRIISPQTVEALTARHRVGMFDHTFKRKIDWGLGFIINSAYYGDETTPYGFGPHASDRTFGHSGQQSSTGFADPEHVLVVAWAFDGMPGEKRHDERLRAVDAAIYEDLRLL